MNKSLSSTFLKRQHMISKDFEIYYYASSDFHNVEEHSHNFFEFYFFLEGDAMIYFSESSHQMKAGDLVIIPPGMRHCVRIHDQKLPYRRVVFWITRHYFSKLKAHSEEFLYLPKKAEKNAFIWHFSELSFQTVQRKIFQIIEEIYSDRFGRRMQVALSVNDLLLYLSRSVYEELHPEKKGKNGENLYQSLLHYIEEHISENLSLDTLSDLFYVSKYHLSHIFKDNMGISLHQYIVKKRLSMSKDALMNGKSPSEVCEAYGFSDYSVFYRAFTKEYGKSPQKYQKGG